MTDINKKLIDWLLETFTRYDFIELEEISLLEEDATENKEAAEALKELYAEHEKRPVSAKFLHLIIRSAEGGRFSWVLNLDDKLGNNTVLTPEIRQKYRSGEREPSGIFKITFRLSDSVESELETVWEFECDEGNGAIGGGYAGELVSDKSVDKFKFRNISQTWIA